MNIIFIVILILLPIIVIWSFKTGGLMGVWFDRRYNKKQIEEKEKLKNKENHDNNKMD